MTARVLAWVLGIGLTLGAPAVAAPLDVLIRGGTIYTGAEAEPFVGDVGIRGDRIVYVGPARRMKATKVVEARGMVVAPGFIDPHTHPDAYIGSDDPQRRLNAPWITQGVSTIVIGPDGIGSPEAGDEARALAGRGIGTNIIPLVGFSPIWTRVVGDKAQRPTPEQLNQMKALVAKGMCQGAAGFSTGLFYAPQSYATTEDVIALAREAAVRGGLYDTHQRDESSYSIGLLASLSEVIRIGREAHMPVHIAHLKALGVDMQGMAPQIVALINQARAEGVDVTADQYPWLASGSNLEASLVPRWAVDGGVAALRARFDDPATLAKIRVEMAENLRRRGGADSLLLTSDDRPWTGQTLAAVAKGWGVDPIDAAIRILRHDPLDPAASTRIVQNDLSGSVASFNMAPADVELIMQQPWVVTSSDGSDGHPRQFATFPQKYAVYVREKHVIDLKNFIRHSTGQTADIYRLEKRGYLRPGYFADVVVLDPDGYAPRADYVHPRELSVGVKALFVNGTLSVEAGQPTGAVAGRALLRTPPAGTCGG
jgi:N-acyl-D-amino-acid deacylase